MRVKGKLLVCIVARHRGETLVRAGKKAGARGGTIALGRTISGGALKQALFLADVSQDVVFTLMGAEAPKVIEAIKSAARDQPKKMNGMALLMDVSGMFMRAVPTTGQANQVEESNKMESGFQLIWVIVNQGFADDVMATARNAGARGGTVVTARGTGTEEDIKFFGVSLVPEKEMLMIVAESKAVTSIIEAINATPSLCEPGGGIVFCMNLEQFIILGK